MPSSGPHTTLATRPGWHSQIGDEFVAPKGVIGIVVAQAFPDEAVIREKIIEGIQRAHPDTVWVMREQPREKHAAKIAWDTFEQFGVEPILAPLVPHWNYPVGAEYRHVGREKHRQRLVYKTHDVRATHRDIELRATCERIVVFHDAKSGVTSEWIEYADARREHPGDGEHCFAKVYVVERGKKKVARRKGRKPVGS